jgi:hypothetical protein
MGLLFFARGAIVAVGERAKCLARFASHCTFLGRCTEHRVRHMQQIAAAWALVYFQQTDKLCA